MDGMRRSLPVGRRGGIVPAQRIGIAARVVISSNGNREGRWRCVVVVAVVVGDGHGDGHGRRSWEQVGGCWRLVMLEPGWRCAVGQAIAL